MKNETYIGQFREFVDLDFGDVRSCTIDTDIGNFLFGMANETFYAHCIPDTIMFEAQPSEKEGNISGFYHYVNGESLWKVRYSIHDYNQPDSFVILELSKLINIAPISPIEVEKMKEVWKSERSMDQILKWI